MKTKLRIFIITLCAISLFTSCGIMRMDSDTNTGEQKTVTSFVINAVGNFML